MTPQERQLIDDLFGRLARLESAPRDPEAAAAITQGLQQAPNAVYALVQTALVQDEALKRAAHRIQELEQTATPQPSQPPGGFLDSMRDSIFGSSQGQKGSVPTVPPPDTNKPVWNSGQALGPHSQGDYQQGGYQGQGGYQQGGYQGQSGQGGGYYDQGMQPRGGIFGGGGGSFLGTAAAAAAGMVGGSLLMNGIRGMMGGGSHQAFGDANAIGGHASQNPWSADQSGSSLARDAGIDDIGKSDQGGRAGLFDQASNDDNDDHNDTYVDDNDDGNDDDDGGSNYA